MNPDTAPKIDGLFAFHKLNASGIVKAQDIANAFHNLLVDLDIAVGPGAKSREFALVRTKLEEACFYAKKAMACVPENQES